MTSNFINQLIDLIFNPYTLLGIGMTIGLIVLQKARQSRQLAWLLFSFCCYTASLGKFQNEWITEPPPLVFPLQQLRDMGRPITIVILVLLLLLGMQTKNGWRRVLIPQPIYYLIMFQAVIFFKTLLYGDMVFALIAAMTFGAVVLMFKLGPSCWLQDEYNFQLCIWSLAMSSVIFVLACTYQGIFNMQAMMLQGRFLGTADNPQQTAILLATTVPCFMFLIKSNKKWGLVKAFWIATLFLAIYFLFLTGSRTGVIAALASILCFYGTRLTELLRIGTFTGVALGIFLSFMNQGLVTSYALLTNRYTLGENTREATWTFMWNSFIDNPLFGVSLEGGRLGFGESSWLAAASTTGLLGFIPLVMMALSCLKMILRLIQLSNRRPIYLLQCTTIIAGLVSILTASFSEAILLGNLTFSVMAFLIYLSLGKYLLDVNSEIRFR
jgi:O-antigen ligase